ncbi:Clavaminate synthase-like protein [Xylariaceae sp. FL0804]|nr:Clavaminate synthase-like protein [Xylariaceae sp. FL0804]
MLLAQDTASHGGGPVQSATGLGHDFDHQEARSMAVPVHPMGVKPLGNRFFASGPSARESLGFLGRLPDEMIQQLLEILDAQSLLRIGSACRFLYAFSQLDDLWKALFLESEGISSVVPSWKGTWRNSYLRYPPGAQAVIDCSNVFSDVLHRPFACVHVPLWKYVSSIPANNRVQRLDNLTYDDFASSWSNKPFVLTECVKTWPACRTWTVQELLRKYSAVEFRAEAVDWPFSTYYEYMSNSQDESPLYLFDRGFAEKMKLEIGSAGHSAYWPPACFGPDLFELLGQERPAHRWLIVGPQRSGSTFHKDPNATSAWNAVCQGSKYWIMFPPATQVPGVYVSEDSSEVTSPLSIAEWLLEFHAEARAVPGCVEGVCKAGEILHVPSGWWHLVVNLEAGIALTQNFVPKSHLTDVLRFLRDKADQVTGFKSEIGSPYDLFIERLRASYPQLLETSLGEMDRISSQRKKRKWNEAVGDTDDTDNKGGFSFGFADDEDADIP